mmetsp:Transcript_109308/g.341988  ORF Transcript_109308/g.341988 Transcript_109308/m.341988 type:complete len:309 (-) Transcript_109308:1086-2012(-)
MLDEDGRHPLDGAEDRAVDDDGPLEARSQLALTPDDLALVVLLHRTYKLLVVLLGGFLLNALLAVLQVEAQGIVEVELDGAALELPPHGILKPDVDLGAVEGPVALLDAPGAAGLAQGLLELRLGAGPELLAAERLLRPGAEAERELEAEELVDVEDKLQRRRHLLPDLVLAAEDVGVVLLEAPHAREPRERAAELVAVEHAEGREPQGQLAVRADLAVEDDAVPGAVHGLQEPLLALDGEAVHVLLVVLVVPGLHEELGAVHVGCNDLAEATQAVLAAHEIHELVVDPGTRRVPESRAWRSPCVVQE